MEIVLSVLAVVVVIFVVIMLVLDRHARKLAPDKYAWLAVLSYSEWKGTRKLIEELALSRKIKIFHISNYFGVAALDLQALENDGLVETRVLNSPSKDGLDLYERRLSPKRVHKKNDPSINVSWGSLNLKLQ